MIVLEGSVTETFAVRAEQVNHAVKNDTSNFTAAQCFALTCRVRLSAGVFVLLLSTEHEVSSSSGEEAFWIRCVMKIKEVQLPPVVALWQRFIDLCIFADLFY